MLAFANGELVPADRPVIGVGDRSFRYGDGLFETVRITRGKMFLWPEHVARLKRGAEFLKIAVGLDADGLEASARDLLERNGCAEGMLRIHLSRGEGARGYSTRGADAPLLVMTTHARKHERLPGMKLVISSLRAMADEPLSQHKTANRLANILARREAEEAGADEAILLNQHGSIAAASGANVFCVREGRLVTPPLSAGGVAGTTRGFILNNAFQFDLEAEEAALTVEDLRQSDAVFLTSAHLLATPAISLDGEPLCALCGSKGTAPPHPMVERVRAACERASVGA